MARLLVSNIFYVHLENLGKITHFDFHMFQMGWFNQQLDGNSEAVELGIAFFFVGLILKDMNPFDSKVTYIIHAKKTTTMKTTVQDFVDTPHILPFMLILWHTFPETNSLSQKMDGWQTSSSFFQVLCLHFFKVFIFYFLPWEITIKLPPFREKTCHFPIILK